MHAVKYIGCGLYSCHQCRSISIDDDVLRQEWEKDHPEGDPYSSQEIEMFLVEIFFEIGRCGSIHFFTHDQVMEISPQVCPHGARAVGIPEGSVKIHWKGGSSS